MKASIIATALLAGVGVTAAAYAGTNADPVIHFTGEVVPQTCQVSLSNNGQFDAGKVMISQLNKAGAFVTAQQQLAVTVKNCTSLSKSDSLQFTFAPTATSVQTYEGNVISNKDFQNGVAFRIMDFDNSKQPIRIDGNARSSKVEYATHKFYTVGFPVQMYTPTGNVKPGKISADAVVKVVYNNG